MQTSVASAAVTLLTPSPLWTPRGQLESPQHGRQVVSLYLKWCWQGCGALSSPPDFSHVVSRLTGTQPQVSKPTWLVSKTKQQRKKKRKEKGRDCFCCFSFRWQIQPGAPALQNGLNTSQGVTKQKWPSFPVVSGDDDAIRQDMKTPVFVLSTFYIILLAYTMLLKVLGHGLQITEFRCSNATDF